MDVLSFIGFYNEHRAQSSFGTTLDLAGPDGEVRWGVSPWQDVTWGELLRANEASTLDGDARRPYLVLLLPRGDGMGATWHQLLEAAKQIVHTMSEVGGAIALGKLIADQVKGRLERGRPVLEEHHRDWVLNGARQPSQVREGLGYRPRHPEDVAGLLGCSQDEAEAVLGAFGFDKEAVSVLWRTKSSEAASVIDDLLDEVELCNSLTDDPSRDEGDFRRVLDRRVRHYLETGHRAPGRGDRDEYGDGLSQSETEDLSFEPVEHREEFEEEEDVEGPTIPLEFMRLRCACSKEDCNVFAGFGIVNGRPKIGFNEPTDHYVIPDMDYFEQVLLQLALSIEQGRMEGDGASGGADSRSAHPGAV